MSRGFEIEVKERMLERLSVVSSQSIDLAFLRDAGVEVISDFATDCLIVHLKAHVWGEDVDTLKMVSPSTWWQAFRERWLPRWWLKRMPVRYTGKVVDLKAVYPGFVPALPNEQYRLTVYHMEATPGMLKEAE